MGIIVESLRIILINTKQQLIKVIAAFGLPVRMALIHLSDNRLCLTR
jgi:hypothetical protein